MEASETTTPTPADAQVADAPTPEAPSTPEVGNEGLSALEQRLATVEERTKPAEADEPALSDDLLDALIGPEGETPEIEGEPVPEGEEDPLVFNTREELDEYIQSQAANVLQPYALSQAMNERKAKLEALQEKYPDLGKAEVRDQIRPILQGLAETYGNEHLVTDPGLVEWVYKALKADEASDAETPAEVAGNTGASLETEAGPGSQGQSEDPEAEFKKRLIGTRSGGDAFT